jgi:hypothetical protein
MAPPTSDSRCDIRVFAAIKNRTLVDIERANGDIDRTTLDIRVSVGAE